MALSMKIRTAAGAKAVAGPARPARAVVCKAQKFDFGKAAAAALAATSLLAGSANALTYDQLQSLTYNQVKGSGIAGTCPVLETGSTNTRDLKAGNYKVQNLCLEPTSFEVKEKGPRGEEEFLPTKQVTRLTYKLSDMSGQMKVGGDGSVEFKEEEGIDFAPTSVYLPGGEPEQFLFTLKKFNAKGNLDSFAGEFVVPSYRGTTYLDPRARGGSQGYEMAVGLQASGDSDDIARYNQKSFAPSKGSAVFSVAKVDVETGEIAGIFESIQPSNTEMGAKETRDIKITGLWYARLDKN